MVLEKANQEENTEYAEQASDHQDEKEKHQAFELEVNFGKKHLINYKYPAAYCIASYCSSYI